MEEKKVDFYQYGYEMGEQDENLKRLKAEIARKYGEEAAYQFLAGFITAQEDVYIKGTSDDYEIRSGGNLHGEDYVDTEMISGAGNIVEDLSVRNNSFYGGTGVSPIYDHKGRFKEPPIKDEGKAK